ncbi:two-component system regulatory protein YycI [Caldalkalibacillus salinus]|uniref:two-component system regulatory protein YycI n=1 Tax=Caldalkalibacillus salinus TaxID=2803787 RepID=UPI0019230BB1|nr:two-component system regulatory protein YycI [Caldalkalibacillus salinus]
MDWSRTKTILIAAFLVLNIFLGYQLWEKKTRVMELAYLNEGSIEEVLSLRDIETEIELTSEPLDMPQLNATVLTHELLEIKGNEGQQIHVQKDQLTASFTDTIDIFDPFDEDAFEEDILSTVTYGDQYVYDHTNHQSIEYVQYYNDFPIFLGTLSFNMESGGPTVVTGYEQVYYHVVNSGTEQTVLPLFHSIRTLLDNQVIPPFSTIKEAQLGYYSQVHEGENQVLTPVWRIIIEVNDQRMQAFVNAYTGAIESDFMQQ